MACLKKRGTNDYAPYYLGGEQKRVCLNTDSLQVAKEKVRQIESALARGTDIPLPTKTPIPQIVTAYVDYLRSVKLERNAQRDIYYLRESFGPICPCLKLKNETISAKGKKHPSRSIVPPIQVNHFEQITTADIAKIHRRPAPHQGFSAQDRQPLQYQPAEISRPVRTAPGGRMLVFFHAAGEALEPG